MVPFTTSICRAVALTLIPAVVAACYAWQVAEPTPAEYLQTHRPDRARVTRHDGLRVELRNPALLGDSPWGTAGGGMALADPVRAVTIAVTDVQRMEVRRFSQGRTIALIVAMSLSMGILVAIAGDWGYDIPLPIADSIIAPAPAPRGGGRQP